MRIRIQSNPTEIDPPRYLMPSDAARLHKQSRAWLLYTLGHVSADRLVVIRHHAPSIRPLSGNWNHPQSASLASNLDHIVAESRAALWIHGHTHQAMDYRLGGTRVVCNPRGYRGIDDGNGFTPGLVIEI